MTPAERADRWSPGLCRAYRRDLENRTKRGPTPEVVAIYKRQAAQEKAEQKAAEAKSNAAYESAGLVAKAGKRAREKKNGVHKAPDFSSTAERTIHTDAANEGRDDV